MGARLAYVARQDGGLSAPSLSSNALGVTSYLLRVPGLVLDCLLFVHSVFCAFSATAAVAELDWASATSAAGSAGVYQGQREEAVCVTTPPAFQLTRRGRFASWRQEAPFWRIQL